MGRGIVAAWCAALLLGQDGAAPIPERIDALFRKHGIDPSRASVLVGPAGSDGTLFERGADRRLVPASNAKLVTTAWALDVYGPDAVFRTRLYADGEIRDGVLRGDLVVVAGGDPNISGRFFGTPTAVFERWRDALGGLARIEGRLVLVDPLFERAEFHPDWERQDVSRWYCAPVRGFALNDNCVDLTVSPGAAAGAPCRIESAPRTAYVRIDNGTRTVAGKPSRPVAFWRKPGTNTIVVRGELGPRSGPVSFSCTVQNPAAYFGTVLLETLGADAPIVEAAEPPASLAGRTPVAVHEFDLARTLQVCNRRSQNLYAEMLFKALGGGSWEGASKRVSEWLEGLGVEPGAVLRDGSGLSRGSALSARDLVAVLRAMRRDAAAFETFRESLAVPGDPEGTLRKRMPELADRVRAKTGHLSGVSSLSGYVASTGGAELVFAILINGQDAADAFQDDVVRLLASLAAD